ncbi:tetratricopeptide repeat protein [Actinomadura madurae]|uniref:tetratricopeptide repeat protein n=1 Tax=Actinomadura madurae TaxID=1993 RepID=UPI0020D21203|nr:tetratricopeptide repeat protein [Actinomadura madurae]MCP9966767.1 tetratricopeptide repeat protein [Actinomadura madurae]
MDRHAEADETLTGALEIFRRLDEPYHVARTLTCLGQARLRAGRPHDAATVLREALDAGREMDAPHVEAGALRELARVAEHQGDPAAERLLLEQALAIYIRLGSPLEAPVRERLAELPGAPPGDPAS